VRRPSPPVRAVSATKPAVRLDRPAPVPGGPFALTPFVVGLRCPVVELRTRVESALRTSNVDYEYNDAKWKVRRDGTGGEGGGLLRHHGRADGRGVCQTPTRTRPRAQAKCYVFKPGGHCHFVVRLYADRVGLGEDAFLLELQRRAGCTRIFHRTYDQVIASFAGLGVLHPEGEAARRFATAAQRASSTGSAPATLALTYDGAVDPASLEDVHLTAGEAHAIVEAFVPLNAMLKQQFDDIVTPAAQSVASLLTSRRVLAAVGMRTRAAQEAAVASRTPSPPATSAPPAGGAVTRQSSVSSVASVASTAAAEASVAADRADGVIVLNLVVGLLRHATQTTMSVEARTACAMALAQLCKEPACAVVVAMPALAALSHILAALGAEAVSARAACLRRELIQLAATLLEVAPATAGPAVAEGLHTRAHAIAFDAHTRGVDPAFDAIAARVSERLTAVATTGRT